VAKQHKGDYEGAIGDLDKAIRLNPSDVSAYVHRGLARQGKRDYDSAIADFTKAIELKPNNADAYRVRGDVKGGKGDYDGAIADYTKAIELKPDYDAYDGRGLPGCNRGPHEGHRAQTG
jgi:tetratricopeptide (TPR) repeat protein